MTTYLRWCRDKAEAERKQAEGYVSFRPSPPPSALVAYRYTVADLGWLQGDGETIRERRPGDK